MSVQSKIQASAASLAPSSRRVADVLTAAPQLAMEKTISELARLCDTSETSVVRFCRAVGFRGYSDLRIALAAEIGRERAQVPDDARYGSDIGRDDTLADAVGKISFAERLGIQETIENLDLGVLAAVVDAIDAAERIIVFGVGAGNLVAHDLQSKLLRIGRTAFSFADAHDAMALASLTGPKDAVVALSHSGATHETVEFARLARARGAATVAITNVPGSALAREGELVLHTAVRETTFRSGAMASRTAQLTLVDCIFVGVAQRGYEATVEALKSTHDAIAPLRDGS